MTSTRWAVVVGFVAVSIVVSLIAAGIGWLSGDSDPVAVCNGQLPANVVIHKPIVEHLPSGIVQVNGSFYSPVRDGDVRFLCTVRDGRVERFVTSP